MIRLMIIGTVTVVLANAWASSEPASAIPSQVLAATAQEIVVTKAGRHVLLQTDGTWHYVTNTPTVTSTSAIETVRAYLKSPTWQERLNYVLQPDKVAALMAARYGSTKLNPDFIILTASAPPTNNTGWTTIVVEIRSPEKQTEAKKYYCDLKMTAEGYRIDWEATMDITHLNPELFRAIRPKNPFRMRVFAQLANYYNYEYRNAQQTHWCVGLLDSDSTYIGFGYIDKESADGRILFQALEDHQSHRIVCDVRYQANSERPELFLIDKVVTVDGWYYEDTNKSMPQQDHKDRQ